MLIFIILKQQNGVWENAFPYNIDTYYFFIALADVMPVGVKGRCNLPGRC